MIEINLIPDVKQELIKAQRVRTLVISSAILAGLAALALVAVLSVYVFGVQTVRSAIADQSIKTENDKFASVEDLSKVLTIQNQLTKISALNDQKKIDSRIFDVLAALVSSDPNAIQVSNLSIDAETNTITIEGQAAQGYSALEIFKKTIGNTVVSVGTGEDKQTFPIGADISTSNVSYGEDTSGAKVLRFTVSFVYPQELFSPTSQALAIKVTNQGNVTDSYLGLPKSIFADRAADLEGTN